MNKYILADIASKKLKGLIELIAKPLPEEIKTLEKVMPSGRLRFESTLYQAEKLKKISFLNHTIGETFVGNVVMLIADDEYDLPFVLLNIALNFGETGKLFTLIEAKPLVWDDESTRKYVDPFRKWREAIGKLPSDPVTSFEEPGKFLRNNISPTQYLRLVPDDYTDEVLNFAEQFFDIYLAIYRKAGPVKDTERRRKMDAFRSEYNKYVLEEDPSGIMLIEAFGRQTADLLYKYLVYI